MFCVPDEVIEAEREVEVQVFFEVGTEGVTRYRVVQTTRGGQSGSGP